MEGGNMKGSRGFTLIEVMITIVIIAIIASVAVPYYRSHIMRSDRTEIIPAMQRMMSAQERYFLNNRTYTDDLIDLGFEENLYPLDNYNITARACSAPASDELELCIEILATATGNQIEDGDIIMNSVGRSVRVTSDEVEHPL
jgi:type IV pilus assembly protein PilE